MGLRFRKTLRITKFLRINLSKGKPSVSVGCPGATLNFRGQDVTGTVGIPGSGLSYRQRLRRATYELPTAAAFLRANGFFYRLLLTCLFFALLFVGISML